jgi:hypothetical protein
MQIPYHNGVQRFNQPKQNVQKHPKLILIIYDTYIYIYINMMLPDIMSHLPTIIMGYITYPIPIPCSAGPTPSEWQASDKRISRKIRTKRKTRVTCGWDGGALMALKFASPWGCWYPICSMYGIFTYKTGWFLGQMLVNTQSQWRIWVWCI